MSEIEIQMQNDLYLWIIDYTKSLDKEGEKQLWEHLGRNDIFDKHHRINQTSFGNDIRLIQKLYREHTARVQIKKLIRENHQNSKEE